jgi:oxidase EvaA
MQDIGQKLIESLLTQDGPSGSVEDVLAWIRRRNEEVSVRVAPVPFRALKEWTFHPQTGNLCHKTGKFFSIEGIRVVVDDGARREWEQPIINQPEVGFLGILTKIIDGTLCFLMQAKIEPGNLNHVQLSPTLQATRSNYTQVHQGRKPLYLEFFHNVRPSTILLDQLQSEQGSRFLRKRNRNIVLLTDEDVAINEDYRWLTLGQIKALMNYDNVVNMDTRTVISGLSFRQFLVSLSDTAYNHFMDLYGVGGGGQAMFESELARVGINTIDEILHWLSSLKSRYELLVDRIPLHEVAEWQVTQDEIVRPDRQYFRVLGAEVFIENREVRSWGQPLVEPMQEGICAFIIKKMSGVFHFLVQAKIECGNFDVVEMAPTVQCLTGRYQGAGSVQPPFLNYVLNASGDQILFDTKQSEEGGRFYREQNRNLVVEAGDDFPDQVPENFCWLTLGQLKEFLRFNNYLNIQARSLIAALKFG